MEAMLEWLEDPTVFRVNRLDAHSDHVTFATVGEISTGSSSLRQVLDGMWKFHWASCPANRPADFWQVGASLDGFTTIRVPGHIEMQGYDNLQYINKLYPWDGHAELRPPHIEWSYNPVGSYVREFDLDSNLLGGRVCISFQGVEQAFYCWLNGHFVGYSEDTFTPSEFDLTPYIQETGNRLCVEVYKRSSAAWLEDQDMFRFSGIFRSVYLYAKPEVSIDDLWLNAGVQEDLSTGTLTIRLLPSGKVDGFRVHCRITHFIDGLLYDDSPELTQKDGYWFSKELHFPNIRLWDYGTPELYHVLLTVYNAEGAAVGYIPYDIGFRRFGIVNKILTLNGKRLRLNGVNRHEWNPASGRCISMNDMNAAMDTFLRNNINAVRTCHYPNRSEWYFLCDKKGIYVMDETNMETHGSWQKDMVDDPSWNIPASLPEWKDCVVDRATSMFQRDKNHPSILFWSCGNESYAGEDILAMADYFRAQDPGRVVHYEGVFHCRAFDQISDVESRMYATPAEIREYLENDPQKPYLNCEYMHNMGNSLGGLESYVKLGLEFPMYQGGFLWDFMDQAIWHKNAQGETVLGYGGDFGERQCDYAFSANGIVTSDGHEKPAMEDVRYWFSPVEARKAHDAANARAEQVLTPPRPVYIPQPMRIVHGDGALGVHGKGFDLLFSHTSGGPVSMSLNGKEWIWRAPRPAFWRAPTENDCGCGFPNKSAIWSAVDGWMNCTGMVILEDSPEQVCIRYDFSAHAMPDLYTSVTYTVHSDGYMDVEAHYEGKPGRPQLPIFGLRFSTTNPIKETTWLGLSGETYPDRYKGSTYGWHTELPHISEYIVPQECGNHMDTHYAKFLMEGTKLEIEMAEKPFAFSAIPYTPAQLEQAHHRDELPAPCRTVITIAGAMRGVGGIDTWMTDVEPAYHISGETDQNLKFRVRL